MRLLRLLMCSAALSAALGGLGWAQQPPPPGDNPEVKWNACKQLADPMARLACYEAWHDEMLSHRPKPPPGGPDNMPPPPRN